MTKVTLGVTSSDPPANRVASGVSRMESISEDTTESIVLLPSSKPCSSCLYICSFIWLLTLAHLVGIAPSCTEGMQEQTKAPSQQASNPVILAVAMVDDAVIPSSNLIGKKA